MGFVNTLRFGAIPISIAWLLIATADHVAYIYAARFLSGFTFGLCLCVMPMYLGEISSPSIRGRLTTLLTMVNKIGVLATFSVGPFVSVRALASMCLLPSLVFFVASFWLPESPYWLLCVQRLPQATETLRRIRGGAAGDNTADDAIAAELHAMQAAVGRAQANRGTPRELFRTHGHRRALGIILALAAIQMLCGSGAILSYAQIIFAEMRVGLQASEVAIVLAAVQLVAALVCTVVVDRVGRRALLLWSVCGTTLSNVAVAAYFEWKRWWHDDDDQTTTALSWMPVTAIMLFTVFFSIGLPSVNLAVLSEIFPTNLKVAASLVYTLTTAALAFTVNKLFQIVSDGAGYSVSFGIFAGFGVVFSALLWFIVPETKGERFEVILEKLEQRKRRSDDDAK